MKTNRKVSAFARVARYLDLQKAKLLYQSFVASTFKYCPLIWLFCGKTANENIDRVHKRALRVLLDDHESTFEVLLAKNNETTIHIQNLRVLMIEMYKTLNCTNPSERTPNMTSRRKIHCKFLQRKALCLALIL